MTRAEIETYLLHIKAEPGSFVLDERADLLEAAIKREVIEARIEELSDAARYMGCLRSCDLRRNTNSAWPYSDKCSCGVWDKGYGRIDALRDELSKLEVPGE